MEKKINLIKNINKCNLLFEKWDKRWIYSQNVMRKTKSCALDIQIAIINM